MQAHGARTESYLSGTPELSRARQPHRPACDSRWGRRGSASASDVSLSDEGHYERDDVFEKELFASQVSQYRSQLESQLAKTPQAMSPQGQPLQLAASNQPNQTTLSQIIAAFKRRRAQAAEMRFEDDARRMEAHYYWQGFQQEWRNLQESAGCLLARSTAMKSEVASKKSKARFKKNHARVQVDLDALDAKVQAVDKLMVELSTRDKRIESAERALDNASRAMMTAVLKVNLSDDELQSEGDDFSETSLAPTSSFGSEASVSAGPEMAPELVDFYNAVSSYKIMRERLSELDIELQEQWERRLLRADQDQPADQTDEEFTTAWKETFVSPEEDFHKAQTMLKEAQKSCIEAGINIPPLEDFQIPNTEGGDEQHNLTKAEPIRAIREHDLSGTTIIPTSTTAITISQRTLFGETLVGQESSTPSAIEPEHHFEDSSPATPLAINDRAAERISQWVDNIDLEAVDQSLEAYASPLPRGPSSAIIASTGNQADESQATGSLHSTSLPSAANPGKKRAASLPQTPTSEFDGRVQDTKGEARLLFKPP